MCPGAWRLGHVALRRPGGNLVKVRSELACCQGCLALISIRCVERGCAGPCMYVSSARHQWGSQRAQQRTGCQERRLALRTRRRWRGRCAPGRPWQPGHCLALRARRQRRGRCAPAGAYMCSPRNCARCLLGGGVWGCRRRRALRAAREARCKACFELLPRARVGWHTARTSVPPPPPSSSGAPVRWLMARGRRASGVAAAPRSHAAGAPAGAPWEARARAARVQTAGEDLVVGGWWCGSNSELPQVGFP